METICQSTPLKEANLSCIDKFDQTIIEYCDDISIFESIWIQIDNKQYEFPNYAYAKVYEGGSIPFCYFDI